MKTILYRTLLAALLSFGLLAHAHAEAPKVVITTNMGVIELELNREKAPKTVENFLSYVESGFYSGTVFHRVIKNFMIQGGGFNREYQRKQTQPPVKNEANNGLKNDRGTIAMARTSVPHSATSQFFINHKDNDFLNYPGQDGWGYCVFGKVTKGMDVVNKIAEVSTGVTQGMRDVPRAPVIIKSIKRLQPPKEKSE